MTIASQVAGKATRDAVFLSVFPVESLPPVIIVSSLGSILVAFMVARWMARSGPGRLVPAGNVLSAGLLLLEWFLFHREPRIAAALVYVHNTVLGAVIISGFWSVISERFDPHTAKKVVARIAGGASIGGLAGGILAERVGAMLGMAELLPVLAGLQFFVAWRLHVLAKGVPANLPGAKADEPPPDVFHAIRTLGKIDHMRNLAVIVVLGTVAAALLDYAFKARSVQSFSGDALLRFFALFHTGVALLTVVVQTLFGKYFLERFGLARTVASLPMVVVAVGLGALAAPGLASAATLRGAENVLRNSLYRQGYELLYTPVPASEKRATKVVVDVGVERLGDALGGALVALLIYAGIGGQTGFVLGGVLVSGMALAVAQRLDAGYVSALERSLMIQAVSLDLSQVSDKTSRATLVNTMHRLRSSVSLMPEDLRASAIAEAPLGAAAGLGAGDSLRMTGMKRDALVMRAAELRSGDAARVRRALAMDPLPPELAGLAVRLLAWDEVAPAASEALGRVAQRITGQLTDALLDPDEEFAVRRRLPRVLQAAGNQRAAGGLLAALADRRFEVRYRAARALVHLRQKNPGLAIDEAVIHAAILRELAVDEPVWANLRLLDGEEDKDGPSLVDDELRARASRGLEQTFQLLSLVLPPEPIKIAFRGLHTDDQTLYGTALEYLESVLPESLREPLWPRLQKDRRPKTGSRPREEVLKELILSRDTIQLNLKQLHAKAQVATPPAGSTSGSEKP